jgi:penicillin-binding protein 1A
MRLISYTFLALVSLGFLGAIASVAVFALALSYYGSDLPDYEQLKDYQPAIVSRIYTGDGHLMAEYAEEKRVFIPVQTIPQTIKSAFISAEDKNFYEHKGVDLLAVARAMATNLRNSGSGRRLIGASTITQQVAKNFLLTNEVSYERKIKEAILAYRIEKAMSKDKVLELYLNEIYLGQRAYGIAAAALTYFDKPLEEITIDEAAYLAALPKAPNNYNPVRHHERAVERRNWVLDRMAEDGKITISQAELAKAAPLEVVERDESEIVAAGFFTEEVRRKLESKYGPDSLYKGGLTVKTSINPGYQEIAVKALRDGLMAYDKRHGWRGPVQNIKDVDGENWQQKMSKVGRPADMIDEWKLAVVLDVSDSEAEIGIKDEDAAKIGLSGVKWARKCIGDCLSVGEAVSSVSQVLKQGDVIMVEEEVSTDEDGKEKKKLVLRQIPEVQGAIIAIDPHTGRILAMQGGWKYGASKFNRATQAWRQPGSAFKPFVYLPALDKGFTPSTRVLDAPFVIETNPGEFWSPSNYSGKHYGPTPIRMGIEKSRNLMTVRMADHIGMETVVEYAERFGIADKMKPLLSYSLGAGETTLLRLTAAYGMLVNGGKRIDPTFIDRIQDRTGRTVYNHDTRPCANCGKLIRWDGQKVPTVPDNREKVGDEKTVYQMVSILEGVVKRGTGRRIAELGRPLAGKTGTTNDSKDAWFIGFSPDLVVGVFAGFDDPRTLGKKETGSSVAAPIFKQFMKEALADELPVPFRVPAGVRHTRVNPKTGMMVQPGDKEVIWEAFVAGTEPNSNDFVLDTQIISGGDIVDPYGQDVYDYDQFNYGVSYNQDYSYGSDQYMDTGGYQGYGQNYGGQYGNGSYYGYGNNTGNSESVVIDDNPLGNDGYQGYGSKERSSGFGRTPSYNKYPTYEEERTQPVINRNTNNNISNERAPAPQYDGNGSSEEFMGTGGIY